MELFRTEIAQEEKEGGRDLIGGSGFEAKGAGEEGLDRALLSNKSEEEKQNPVEIASYAREKSTHYVKLPLLSPKKWIFFVAGET